jgi:two-component system invasion response regulator UvrY
VIKVLLADDHELVRTAIKTLLQDTQDIKVVGEASTGEQAVLMTKALLPNIVLMDINMPGIGGLGAITRIMRSDLNVKILVLTAYQEEPYPARLMEMGIHGYLTKGSRPDELIRAIRLVNAGQHYISPIIAQKIATEHYDGESPFELLSTREMQIMLMVTEGKKTKEIAEALHLSSKTINSCRYRIFKKLKLTTDVELTLLAMRYGVIDKKKGG